MVPIQSLGTGVQAPPTFVAPPTSSSTGVIGQAGESVAAQLFTADNADGIVEFGSTSQSVSSSGASSSVETDLRLAVMLLILMLLLQQLPQSASEGSSASAASALTALAALSLVSDALSAVLGAGGSTGTSAYAYTGQSMLQVEYGSVSSTLDVTA